MARIWRSISALSSFIVASSSSNQTFSRSLMVMPSGTVREREAQARDIPRGRVLKDEALTEIAAHPPETPEALERQYGRLRALEWLGKWSMHDVLVLALTIFFMLVAAFVGQWVMRPVGVSHEPGSAGHAEFCRSVYELALACDIILAADHAGFADTHARVVREHKPKRLLGKHRFVDGGDLVRERIDSRNGKSEVRVEFVSDAKGVRLKSQAKEAGVPVVGTPCVQHAEAFEVGSG